MQAGSKRFTPLQIPRLPC